MVLLEFLVALDNSVLLFVQNYLRITWLDLLLPLYTTLGDGGLLWIGISIVLLIVPKTRKVGFMALLAMLLGLLLNNMLLKNFVARPRPYLTVAGLAPLMTPPDPNSFPSGHTCAAFAFAGVLCRGLQVHWGKVLAIVAALLMGYSRIYVGVHFPTDVLVGGCVGVLCSQIVWIVWKWKKPSL